MRYPNGTVPLLFVILFFSTVLKAQDSTHIPLSPKYLSTVSSKADKYYSSITSKTEKTLERLSKWESKIKTLLEKASPATAQQLFGNNQLTFSSLLQQFKEAKQVSDEYQHQYDEYRDKVTTSLKYLDEKKERLDSSVLKPLTTTSQKMSRLDEQLKKTAAVQHFITERKKQLAQQALKTIGKSKYLKKISKDSYYYVQALGNYKETFSDPKKTEELALKILQKIPAFNEFIKKNSLFASIFRLPGDPNDPAYLASLAGLQTNAQVNALIQTQLAAGGAGARQQFQQNLQSAQSQLRHLKDKVFKSGGGSSDAEMPEGFKPNDQKTKSFLKRLEYGTTIQTQKATSFFPVTSDIGLSVGYKLNDKSLIGLGASYKLGFGRGWQNIRLSQQGAALRSFIDWKLKKSLWISGGYEMNYRNDFNRIAQLKELSAWQVSGLLGLSKSIPVKTKFFKKTKMQLLWDFMSYQQLPRTQPIIFRMGYNF